MANTIVQINVSQQVAPAPSTLQRTGAFVSQGGTTLSPGEYSLLTEEADLDAILFAPIATSSVVLNTGTVTVTLASPHGIPSGDVVQGIMAGITPAAYNGTFAITSTGANTFTYALGGSPGAVTVQGTYRPEMCLELEQMANTFFAQGTGVSVYVLELGMADVETGVQALADYIEDPALRFYSYLFPRPWGDSADARTLALDNEGNTAMVYFFPTLTLSNYGDWAASPKSVFALVESDDHTATEFSAAAPFYVTLNYNPSNVNMVTPMAFAFVFGVTALVLTGPQQTALKAAFVNWVTTGAEGGISNKIIKWGTTGDGRDFTYWYSVDWLQINEALALANEIINGSNNPQAPLYYDQKGINRLQARAQAVVNSGISFGLINGAPAVTAVPFSTYVAANPSDYPAGIYNGLAVTYTPQRGFTSITFNITVTDFPAA